MVCVISPNDLGFVLKILRTSYGTIVVHSIVCGSSSSVGEEGSGRIVVLAVEDDGGEDGPEEDVRTNSRIKYASIIPARNRVPTLNEVMMISC